MSVNARIINAVTPVVPTCVPNIYRGKEPEYCTFNYFTAPAALGENTPGAIVYNCQLHYVLPYGDDPTSTVGRLCAAIGQAGFTWPGVEDASDEDGLHFVLEFEGCDGGY